MDDCTFCKIVSRSLESPIVWEDADTLAFLDHRPLFPGHCLLIPKEHRGTLLDLPPDLVQALFRNAQTLTRAVESAMKAEGSFVAMNNRISQSVPHFHIHIVPRSKGDGLKGFFWPRQKYRDAAEMKSTEHAIRVALAQQRHA
jgi:histidine triad (HIT) family protein